MATRYLTVSWDQLHHDCVALAGRLIGRGPVAGGWRGIVAIARGGLVPAAIIARELECRLIDTVCVASYQHEVRGTPVLLKPPSAAADGEGFLVLDDLVDSGSTLRLVRDLLPRAYFACPYAKPAGRTVIDAFIAEVPQQTWVVFPWDRPHPAGP